MVYRLGVEVSIPSKFITSRLINGRFYRLDVDGDCGKVVENVAFGL